MLRRLFANRWLRRLLLYPLAVLLVLAVAGFITYHVTRADGVAKRDKRVAELDVTDPGWRAVDLCAARNAALPPVEQNAAELAHLAYGKLPKSYLDRAKQQDAGAWLNGLTPPRLPHPDDVAELREALAGAKDAVEQARAVRHIPGGGFPLVFSEPLFLDTKLQKQQDLREVMSLLTSDALLRAYDGDGDGALDSCLAILAVERGIGDEPLLISQLIRMAGVTIAVRATERTLGWCDHLTDAKLIELGDALAAEVKVPRLRWALRGERAAFFRLLENLDEGRITPQRALTESRAAPTPSELTGNVILSATLPEQQATALELFNRLIAAADLPPGSTRNDQIEAVFRDEAQLTRWKNILVHLMLPAVNKVNDADARTVATLQTARVALACERHRLKTGAFPKSFSELPKELLAEVPEDPFTGRPLLLAAFDDGIAVYSTGIDGKDDGGVNLDATKKEKADVGVRLYLPKHRRQPPAKPDE